MNRPAVFFLILFGVGLFLWTQKEELPGLSPATSGGLVRGSTPVQETERYIIREKVKPGGYIGWHETERDHMTSSARQTRQASYYYFVCTGRDSGTRKIFLVPESTFNMERIGNILTAQRVATFQEVSNIEEPPLPPSFQFRRRDPQK